MQWLKVTSRARTDAKDPYTGVKTKFRLSLPTGFDQSELVRASGRRQFQLNALEG